MKNRLFIAMMLSATVLTLASCGKTEQETLAKADTETVIPETEEMETETETEKAESIMDENGIYKDFAEDYVTYTEIEEKEMYGTDIGNMYENPNMTKGELHIGGRVDVGSTFTVNATCEIDNTLYYRTAPNDRNQMFIIEATLLSDTPPTTEPDNNDTSQNTNNNNTDNTYTYTESSDLPPELQGPNASIEFHEVTEPKATWDDIDPALIEQAAGMVVR